MSSATPELTDPVVYLRQTQERLLAEAKSQSAGGQGTRRALALLAQADPDHIASEHMRLVRLAVAERKPVRASVVDIYKMALPSGYARRRHNYVFSQAHIHT